MTMSRGARVLAALALLGGLSACELDFTDPNQPPEEEVIVTPATLARVAVGLQAQYSDQLADPVYVTGLVTNEIGATPTAFESYRRADAGSPITGDDGPSLDPWSGQYDVIRTANVLIENVPQVGFGPGTTSGLLALAKLYKAMAFGNLYQHYESFPLVVQSTTSDAPFATRAEAMTEILRLLEEARQHLATTPPSPEFNTTVLAPGFNLAATIDAMLARYNLIGGNLDAAMAAAQRVPLTSLSEFRFATGDVNPLWNLWYNSGNAYQMRAKQSFRLQAEAGDQRVAYWVSPDTIPGATQRMDQIARYNTNTRTYVVYFPDEMRLIMAEVHARQNRLSEALALVNAVRTPCTSTLAEPVACLPALTLAQVPTQQAMLDEILRQRRYELYLQGLRWSDLRRFGQPVKYEFMPVPTIECDRNQSAPC
ncbi:RagB/SusD family nutrient uptake outer membrane protein [Longimicrobium sp.]|uniref:RagB/SusD family nutrient uptake outer membrane protein n=1 Tax=Longimicrobium sp. TaxID=2029185 RepID=UPI003B3B9E77